MSPSVVRVWLASNGLAVNTEDAVPLTWSHKTPLSELWTESETCVPDEVSDVAAPVCEVVVAENVVVSVDSDHVCQLRESRVIRVEKTSIVVLALPLAMLL